MYIQTITDMWEIQSQDLPLYGGLLFTIKEGGQALDYQQFLTALADDGDFRSFFIQCMQSLPYPAYFWEALPAIGGGVGQVFQFVVIPSGSLARVQAEPHAFQSHFKEEAAAGGVVAFPNLGGDAQLIVPCPGVDGQEYPHLAAFMRDAPSQQIHLFWETAAREMLRHANGPTRWFSTAGLGVYWLHLRLDTRPKYYRYAPYRDVGPAN